MSSTSSPAIHLGAKLHSLPPHPGLALIFPGQGSQSVGMGQDLCQGSPAAREIFQRADAVLGLPLSRLCFEGPEEELRQTAHAQPAIMTASLAGLAAALEAGALRQRPAFLAGHSLGEYTALVAAGALGVDDALRLVWERGRLMQEAGERQAGTMAAVLGLEEDAVREICRLSGAEVCNFNSPTQIVLGGPQEAIERAAALARKRGGRFLPLNVSGAFHTSLMSSAAREFARFVDSVPLSDPLIPVVANGTARPMTTAAEVREELKRQIVSPVLWHQSVLGMVEAGAATFVEIGPGRVLTSLLKRAVPQVRALSIDGMSALEGLHV